MFYIIIRGPAGVGKSSIAEILKKELNAVHISFDKIMKENKLDVIEGDGISEKNFIKANNLILKKALRNLKNGKIVIFDGCFYREGQLTHLLENIPYKYYIFTLKASQDICFERNRGRSRIMPQEAIKDVHNLVSKKDFGVIIDTENKSKEDIVKEILSYIER